MNQNKSSDNTVKHEDEVLRPTYAPVAMAMGVAMSTWGLMALSLNINAMWFMSIAGIGLATWALKRRGHHILTEKLPERNFNN